MTELTTIRKEVRRGNVVQARKLLVAYIKEQAEDTEAWYILSHIAPTRAQQVRALTHLLRIEPGSERAEARLRQLQMVSSDWADGQTTTEAVSERLHHKHVIQSAPEQTLSWPAATPVPEPSQEESQKPVEREEVSLRDSRREQNSTYHADWILSTDAFENIDYLDDEEPLDLVQIFFEDVKRLPIISNKSQQFWLGAQLQAPARLAELEQPVSREILAQAISSCQARLHELCVAGDIRLARLRGWVSEARRARIDIYQLKRSRVRRFLRRIEDGPPAELSLQVKATVYEFVELLCLLHDQTLSRLTKELEKQEDLPAINEIVRWIEYDLRGTSFKEHALTTRNKAKETLAAGYLRYGIRIASNYIGQGLAFLDLVQEAYLGLLRGAEKYNYREYEQFAHYGTTWVWQHVTRAIAMQARTVRLPVHLLGQIEALNQADTEHASGCCPLAQDLSVLVALDLLSKVDAEQIELTGINGPFPVALERRYRQARRKVEKWEILRQRPESLGELALPVLEEQNLHGEWVELVEDRLVDVSSNVFKGEIERASFRQELLDLLKQSGRVERDYQMIVLRYGLEGGGERTLREVGTIFGLTRERVRQIEARVLDQLQVKLIYDSDLAYAFEASWLDSWLANISQLPIQCSSEIEQTNKVVNTEKARLDRLIDELPRSFWGGRQRESTREEQLAAALRSLGGLAHYEEIAENLGDEESISVTGAYQILLYSEDVFVPLGEGYFSLVEWEAERAKESTPVLPFCPQPLPNPPDYEDAFFEAVLVAHKKLQIKPLSADELISEMVAWAKVEDDVPRWRKHSYLSSFYAVGLTPYTFYFGGENTKLRSQLPDLPIRELRSYCLHTLTERVAAMPQFWWVLGSYAPARPSVLGEELADAHPEEIDDALYRLYLLAGLGAVRRLTYGHYELAPLGMELAQELGARPQRMETDEIEFEDDIGDGFSAIAFDW